MKVKICGLKKPAQVEQVVNLRPDLIGFIFFDGSKRRVEEFPSIDYDTVRKTGVFVNTSIADIIKYTDEYRLDLIQLHGDESADYLRKLKQVLPFNVSVMKAFRVNDDFDFSQTESSAPYCKYFLFDAAGKSYGGNGKAFNWALLENYSGGTPFFIGGGLGLENVDEALSLKLDGLIGLDFNSKLEIEPGVKDINKVALVINKIKENEKINS